MLIFQGVLSKSKTEWMDDIVGCQDGVPKSSQPFSVCKLIYLLILYMQIWSNYSDLTRPHLKWWFSKLIPLFQGNPGW